MGELDVDFFSDLSVVADPNPYFDHLRTKCPVLREPYHGAVMVTGYEEALEVFKNRDSLSSVVAVTGPIPPLPFSPQGDDIRAQLERHRNDMPWSAHLATQDGAAHAALRAILTGLLTFTRLKNNEAYVRVLADRLIDDIIDRGSCDFVSEYAHALSTLVIADLLGVPEADREEILTLLGEPPTQIGGDAAHKIAPDPLAQLDRHMTGYIVERRKNPCGDMMSDLANAKFRDGAVPDVAVPVRLAKFLFGAGQDTSARLMASCFKILGECPHLQQRLRAEPHRIPDFIEETLRIESPIKALSRLAQATTSLGGVRIAAGTVVTACLGAANRDPRHFEAPDEFNMDRPNLRDHVAFSRGIHACPGAPLARAETRISVERFLERMSDIRLSEATHGPAGARRYVYEPTYLLRGLRALQLEFTAAR